MTNFCSRTKNGPAGLILSLAAFLLLSSAGMACGAQKGEDVKNAARKPLPDSKIILPDYYGFYAVDGKHTVELKNEDVDQMGNLLDGKPVKSKTTAKALSFNEEVEFLFFDKSVKGNAGTWEILELSVDPTTGKIKPSDNRIKCRTKPLGSQQEMLRIIPDKVLSPGAYEIVSGQIPILSAHFHKYTIVKSPPAPSLSKRPLHKSADASKMNFGMDAYRH